jgi:hypothetical protein
MPDMRTSLPERWSSTACYLVTILALAILSSRVADAEAPNRRPVIQELEATLYGGYLVVTGMVTDADDDPRGWTVFLAGSVLGTCRVRPNGEFTYVTFCNCSYGEVGARTQDPHGAESLWATAEFFE